ncbi:MAG: DEAD/DEAH box helicase [Chloroflexi bacterium]|nr:DEAD/DEAH box helicase [Chloroflexota bacterium]
MSFHNLDLNSALLRVVKRAGYTEPTPIQVRAIPHILKGRDLIGCAHTGSGKTAAFALPIVQMLDPVSGRRRIRALVLAPTRELAAQIDEEFGKFCRDASLRHVAIFGGVGQQPQVDALRRGVDIVVATPGRLQDLMNQGYIRLDQVEFLVLDEADRMLDMGFINDVKRIIKQLPRVRQTMLFSATMPPAVQDLSKSILKEPINVEANPQASTVESIAQSIYFVESGDKRALLKHILRDPASERVLVFTRTKHRANNLAKQLNRARIPAEAIHGNKSQSARTQALSRFKSGRTAVLVATDIAARGLDIESVSHVINFDLPNVPESYVHRIGRTARAGASGIAYSFCDVNERKYLHDIQKLIRKPISVVGEHPYLSAIKPPQEPTAEDKSPNGKRGRRGRRSRANRRARVSHHRAS